MNQISPAYSLIEFNRRVLYQGTPVAGRKYSLVELKDLLFFNKIFISNTDEIFERYDTSQVNDAYVDLLNQYVSNVSQIIRLVKEADPSIHFTRSDSFERRLAMYERVSNKVLSVKYPWNHDRGVSARINSNKIYYAGITERCELFVASVDEKRDVYSSPMKRKYSDKSVYWKTDDCIRDFISNLPYTADCVVLKVTIEDGDYGERVKKVEYNGDTRIMKNMATIFGPDTLIIQNPFIYIDDIEQIINENIIEQPPKTVSVMKLFDLQDIINNDIIIEYPMDSFEDYLQFLKQAAYHSNVRSISITLYRIGNDPALFYILRDAVNNGIEVNVNMEMYASGEAINAFWKSEMERAGINVTTYMCGKMKVHTKLTLVEFRNGKSIAQIGTGNYHTKTTTQYTDLSLMTADDEICQQVEKVFCMFRGEEVNFTDDLIVTKYNAREEIVKLIDQEADKGDDGNIVIKCNALSDNEIIAHLNNAANMGCHIELIIRGICTWVPTQFKNVQVKSIVWDKLEHSRVYSFGKNDPTIYIGSLDLVKRKLDQRIEAMVKIKDPDVAIKLCRYLNRYITNTVGSWIMSSSGLYIKE